MLKFSVGSAGFCRPSASKFVKCYTERLLSITAEVSFDELRCETVEARGYRGVGGEQIARSRDRQCYIEAVPGRLHETPRAFQHGERCVPFIQVANLRLDAERGKEPPAADPKDQLLHQAQVRPAAIKLAGDPAIRRKVRRVIAVEQVELQSADLGLPSAQPYRIAGQVELQPQPLTICVRNGVIGNWPGSLYG